MNLRAIGIELQGLGEKITVLQVDRIKGKIKTEYQMTSETDSTAGRADQLYNEY